MLWFLRPLEETATRLWREQPRSRELSLAAGIAASAGFETGQLVRAGRLWRHCLTVSEELLAANPQSAQAARDVLISLERIANARVLAGDRSSALSAQERSLAIARRLWAQCGESSWEFGRTLVVALLRTSEVAGRAGGQEAAATHLGECRELLERFKKAGTQLDPAMQNLLSQLRTAPRVRIPDLLAQPRPEMTLAERRESAARFFQKGFWEAASGDLQKLLDAGEPLAEYGPKLITCLLNAHETPLESYVSRIRTLLQQLEQAGRADLAAPLREQLQARLSGPPKRWWKFW